MSENERDTGVDKISKRSERFYFVYVILFRTNGKPQCYIGQTSNSWRRMLEHKVRLRRNIELVRLYLCRTREDAIHLESMYHLSQRYRGLTWCPEEVQASFMSTKAMQYVDDYLSEACVA